MWRIKTSHSEIYRRDGKHFSELCCWWAIPEKVGTPGKNVGLLIVTWSIKLKIAPLKKGQWSIVWTLSFPNPMFAQKRLKQCMDEMSALKLLTKFKQLPPPPYTHTVLQALFCFIFWRVFGHLKESANRRSCVCVKPEEDQASDMTTWTCFRCRKTSICGVRSDHFVGSFDAPAKKRKFFFTHVQLCQGDPESAKTQRPTCEALNPRRPCQSDTSLWNAHKITGVKTGNS